MYAIIANGGKQYRVQEGDLIKLEKMASDVNDAIELDKVLMVGGEAPEIGNPYLKNAKVKATVVEQGRGTKVNILKFRRRKNYMKRQGHRQDYTQVKIEAIQLEG